MIDDPSTLFRAGNFTRVNVMAGITDLEFASPTGISMEVSHNFC